MMTKTWNFVTKKIADGVNKFLSFFCLILIWCVCMIFSNDLPSNVTWGVFDSVRLHCWKYTMSKNPPINDEHSLCPQCLGFPNSASGKHPVEVFGRCLTRERMQKLINYRHIHRSHYMIPISNTEMAGAQRNMEKGTVNNMTTLREMTTSTS